MLHLQGYDHEEAHAAGVMEDLEKDILARLGYDNPYA
jgi:probable rRNA maturation factor